MEKYDSRRYVSTQASPTELNSGYGLEVRRAVETEKMVDLVKQITNH